MGTTGMEQRVIYTRGSKLEIRRLTTGYKYMAIYQKKQIHSIGHQIDIPKQSIKEENDNWT